MKPIRIGILGAGGFSCAFLPLFKAHPLVADVSLAEKMPDRLSHAVKSYRLKTTFTSFEDLLRSDVEGVQDDFFSSLAPVHDHSRLPREFAGLPNGHFGSHQFLVDDFVRSCTAGTLPPVNVWTAARYCAPGIIAHASALRDGERLPIPDLGSAPA